MKAEQKGGLLLPIYSLKPVKASPKCWAISPIRLCFFTLLRNSGHSDSEAECANMLARRFSKTSIKSLLTGTCFLVSSLWETGISTV